MNTDRTELRQQGGHPGDVLLYTSLGRTSQMHVRSVTHDQVAGIIPALGLMPGMVQEARLQHFLSDEAYFPYSMRAMIHSRGPPVP